METSCATSTTVDFTSTLPVYTELQRDIRTIRICGVEYPFPNAPRYQGALAYLAEQITYESSRYIAGYRDGVSDCIQGVINIQKLYDDASPERQALRRIIGFFHYITEETETMADKP